MKLKVYILVFLSMGAVISSSAQYKSHLLEKRGDRYLRERIKIRPGRVYYIEPSFTFTSVFVKCRNCNSFEDAAIKIGQHHFPLQQDVHAPNDPGIQSNLIVFSTEVNSFNLISGTLGDNIEMIYLNATGITEFKKDRRSKRSDNNNNECDQPESIDQGVWRDGLPEPSYVRSFSDVSNIILHHSATDNSLTDYGRLVRNIYLFHTEGNGWSDIGYNYLIAPNGIVYEGRDPGSGEQDNVVGAHFCGRNSGTMGICLLGDYSDHVPSESMLQSLIHLLTWKTLKEDIDPLAWFSHPVNANLATIAGHRNGCNTECPGEQIYDQLSKLRQNTLALQQDCENTETFSIYPNPTTESFQVSNADISKISWKCFNIQGKEIKLNYLKDKNNQLVFNVSNLSAGIYVLYLEEPAKVTKKRFIVL